MDGISKYKNKNADTQLHRSFIQIHMYMCTHFGCRLLDELTIATIQLRLALESES